MDQERIRGLSTARPSIEAIIAQYGLPQPVASPSLRDVANVLVPYSPLSEQRFYYAMKLGSAWWRTLGVKVRKQFEKNYLSTYKTVVEAFFLASQDVELEIITVLDTLVGSSIVTKIPIDIWSFEGVLIIDIIDIHDTHPTSTTVRGTAEIKGQIYDHGKSTKTLSEIFLAGERHIGCVAS